MPEDLKLQMKEDLPLRDVVFQTLREAILRGRIKPGERLMEQTLAQKLGVSRTPIREAIRMLEQEGLAVTVPRKGAQVARMTEKDMEDVLQIREALEQLAVSLACDFVTEEQIAALETERMRFELSLRSDDIKKIAESDVRLHELLYEASGNPKLVGMLSNLREQMYRYRVEYLKDPAHYPNLISEHKEIVEGLRLRNKQKVHDAMARHMSNQAAGVKEKIREQNA